MKDSLGRDAIDVLKRPKSAKTPVAQVLGAHSAIVLRYDGLV
jgi:hypothetical protein